MTTSLNLTLISCGLKSSAQVSNLLAKFGCATARPLTDSEINARAHAKSGTRTRVAGAPKWQKRHKANPAMQQMCVCGNVATFFCSGPECARCRVARLSATKAGTYWRKKAGL